MRSQLRRIYSGAHTQGGFLFCVQCKTDCDCFLTSAVSIKSRAGPTMAMKHRHAGSVDSGIRDPITMSAVGYPLGQFNHGNGRGVEVLGVQNQEPGLP